MPFVRSAAQTFNKAAALWRRHGALPLAIGLGIPDVYYSDDKTAALSANIASVAATYAVRKSPSFLTGILAPVAAYGTVRGAFYYNKQKHNTLEGFQENGVAGKSRKSYGFGSGWMGGTPTSLMGQAIDPEISAYREDIMDVRSERRALYARIHQAEEASLAQMGSLSGPDYMAANIERIKGINAAREGLQAVNLSRFNVEIEDADTLVLKRGGLSGLFDNEIQIRLAGIDAPETAGHAGDPLEEVRFWQAQPGGEEAAERLRQIMGTGEGFQAVVGPDKTYGRYLGALIGPGGENINIQLAREGMVAALPFGEAEEEVVQRGPVGRAQAQAQVEGAGIWGMARYQAIAQAQEAIGQPITYNTMTRLDKLSQNLNLGAYASFLQDMGTERRALTPEEQDLSRRMGYSLRKSHGPKRFNKAKNPIKGHDSGHWGRNWVTDAIDSDFEPGQSVRWIYRAMEAGVSTRAITEAGSRMGAGVVGGQLKTAAAASGRDIATIAKSLEGIGPKETLRTIQKEFQVRTGTGETFVRGRELGQGAFKDVSLVHQPTGQTPAVLAEAIAGGAEAKFGQGQLVGLHAEGVHVGAAKHMADIGMKRAQDIAKKATNPFEAKRVMAEAQAVVEGIPFREKLAAKAGMPSPAQSFDAALDIDMILAEQAKAIGGKRSLSLAGEAELQHKARKILGDVVPDILGTTDRGFIQEYAGKIMPSPAEIHARSQRITSKYTLFKDASADPLRHAKGHARRTEAIMEQGLFPSSGEQIAHLDMHAGNIAYRGGKTKIIDWGLSLVGQKLSRVQKDFLLSTQKASSVDRMFEEAAGFASNLRGAFASSRAAGGTFNVKAWRETVQKRLLKTPATQTTSVGTTPAVRVRRNRLQTEASGIGLKMNAARRGSKTM